MKRRNVIIVTIILIIIVLVSFIIPMSVGAASDKYIVVHIDTNRLNAVENGKVVFSTSVSTGRPGHETPTGSFKIIGKLPLRTMQGCNDDGCWVVPNVPDVMYFDYNGDAIHGTYWHNDFKPGSRHSHGCVNVSLEAARWLYDWAVVGTPVIVKAK